MADFAEIGEIISRCMGHDNNKFLDAYYKNIDLQSEEAIAANPVGMAITKFIENRQGWEGTATELLTELEPVAFELKINTVLKLACLTIRTIRTMLYIPYRVNIRIIRIVATTVTISQTAKAAMRLMW